MKRLVEKETFTCTKEQKETLNKIQKLGFKKSVFIRKSIAEKIERELFWVNPVQKDNEFDRQFKSISNLMNSKIEWMRAQQKTFDKSRTLIFVKK